MNDVTRILSAIEHGDPQAAHRPRDETTHDHLRPGGGDDAIALQRLRDPQGRPARGVAGRATLTDGETLRPSARREKAGRPGQGRGPGWSGRAEMGDPKSAMPIGLAG